MNYPSEIELNVQYRDTATGFKGQAIAVSFFQHGCERVTLRGMDHNGRVVEYGFDSPEVVRVDDDKPIKPSGDKPGGPHGLAPAQRRP